MTRVAAVALSATAVVLSAAPAHALSPVTRAEARRAAVKASSQTCSAVPWCEGYGVVPARRCRRMDGGAVSCRMWFVAAGPERCGGVVTIKRGRTGRLAIGMAVPMNCAGTASATGA